MEFRVLMFGDLILILILIPLVRSGLEYISIAIPITVYIESRAQQQKEQTCFSSSHITFFSQFQSSPLLSIIPLFNSQRHTRLKVADMAERRSICWMTQSPPNLFMGHFFFLI